MKSLLLSFIIWCFVYPASAQILGTDSVCPGYVYNYSVVISGADSLSWNFPSGWQVLQNNGQQVQVFCNVNAGQICVTGYDSTGNNIGQFCKNVVWQGGGGSWHINVLQHVMCQCYTATVSVVPDNSPPSCTCTGTPSINLHYAYYNNPWPSGQFQGYIDSPVNLNPPLSNSQTFYVYLVDVTFGIPNAVRVLGGTCPGIILNTFTMPVCYYIQGTLTVTPDTACIGDTVTIQYTHNLEQFFPIGNYFNWQVANGFGTLIPPTSGPDHVQAILDSAGMVSIIMWVLDINAQCTYWGYAYPSAINCTYPPTAFFYPQGSIEICESSSYGLNTIVDFTDSSLFAVGYQWLFPGGSPSSSNLQNPPFIRYYTPGTYDVTLIVSNPLGSDTLTRHNLVIVDSTSTPVITVSGDTLHAGPGYFSYHWFYNGLSWPGTDSIFVTQYNGPYYVEVTNSFNCTGRSATIQFTLTGEEELAGDRLPVYFDEQNRELRINNIHCKEISVYDITGQEIKYMKGNYLNTSGLTNGVYILRCNIDNRNFYRKFLVD